MKLTLERDALLFALERAGRVVERRNTIPILSNIKVAAEAGGRLTLSGTDLDMAVTTSATAEVAEAGETTFPAETVAAFVKKLPAGSTVTLETADKDRIVLKAGRSRITVPTLPVADFPDFAAGEMTCRFTLPAASLATLIERVGFAISTEETRYYLNGIHLHIAAGAEDATPGADGVGGGAGRAGLRLVGVATDGHRLALHRMAAPDGAEALPPLILPRKAVAEIARLIKPLGEAEVTLEASATRLCLATGATRLATKLIDGTFPEYDRVIPKDNEAVATLDAAALDAAVGRVATVSSERGRAVKFGFEQDLLTLSVSNPDTGEARDEVTAAYGGEPFEIGFNGTYVAEMLAVLPGKTARLAMKDAGSPLLVTAEGDDASLFVLMPMRV